MVTCPSAAVVVVVDAAVVVVVDAAVVVVVERVADGPPSQATIEVPARTRTAPSPR